MVLGPSDVRRCCNSVHEHRLNAWREAEVYRESHLERLDFFLFRRYTLRLYIIPLPVHTLVGILGLPPVMTAGQFFQIEAMVPDICNALTFPCQNATIVSFGFNLLIIQAYQKKITYVSSFWERIEEQIK
jgi:hypothetical protein